MVICEIANCMSWCQEYIILPSTPKLELWWNIGTGTPIKFVYGLTPRRNPIAAPGECQLDDMKYDPHHRITQHFFSTKVWVKKNVTHIALNFSNLDCFSEKSFKSSKNTHAKDLKMVRQVNIVKKLPPGIMIKYKIHFWENTNFVKKEFAKKVILHLWVSCKLCLL